VTDAARKRVGHGPIVLQGTVGRLPILSDSQREVPANKGLGNGMERVAPLVVGKAFGGFEERGFQQPVDAAIRVGCPVGSGDDRWTVGRSREDRKHLQHLAAIVAQPLDRAGEHLLEDPAFGASEPHLNPLDRLALAELAGRPHREEREAARGSHVKSWQ
jgi:hypothetical protein